MKRFAIATGLLVTGFGAALASTAHAQAASCSDQVTAANPGYTAVPFDPTVAGGPKCPTTTVAGPYPIPGRLEFMNYDMNPAAASDMHVGFWTDDHVNCYLTGYRQDDGSTPPNPNDTAQLPSECGSNAGEGDVWYETGTALDGTTFPAPGQSQPYIGAAHPGNYVNITVNVATTGTYALSSTWASGGQTEGGNGTMELMVFVDQAVGADKGTVNTNSTAPVDWGKGGTITFPNWQTAAMYHDWHPYPNFAQLPLTAGCHVITMMVGNAGKHLNLGYVDFSLVLSDGGLDNGDGSVSTGSSGSTTASSGAAASTGTPAGESGATTASGAAAGSPTGGDSGTDTGSGAAAGSTTGGASGSEEASGSTTSTGGSGASASGSNGSSSGSGGGGGGSGNGSNNGNGSSGGKSGCSVTALGANGAQSGVGIALGLLGATLMRSRRRSKRA